MLYLTLIGVLITVLGFLRKLKRSPKPTIGSIPPKFDLASLRSRTSILVIDDDVNAFPTEALNREGFKIQYWPAVESLDRLEKGDFDIIVLDIPGVARSITPDDGLGILKHLKEAAPNQIVIAFSGQSFDLSKQQFFKLADDVLKKPADTLACKQVLDHLISTKMSATHHWKSIAAILKREGVSQQQIDEIEKRIATAVTENGKVNASEIVTSVTGKADMVVRTGAILEKLSSLLT